MLSHKYGWWEKSHQKSSLERMNHHYFRGIYVGGILWFKLETMWLIASDGLRKQQTSVHPLYSSQIHTDHSLSGWDPVNLCLPSFSGASGDWFLTSRHDFFEGRGPPKLSTETKLAKEVKATEN